MALAPLKLPKLQGRMPIVDNLGRPVDFFLRFFNIDFSGAIERNEANQAAIIADLQAVQAEQATQAAEIIAINDAQQDEIDRLNRVLAGTEAFTGLNVGGTDVKPFLDKTDGSALTDADGLDDALVSTAKIAAQAVTENDRDFDATAVNALTTSDVVLATVTVTTSATDRVDLLGSISITTLGSGGSLGTNRASPTLQLREGANILTSKLPTSTIDGVQIGASPAIPWSYVPGAGTWTFTLVSVLASTTNVILVSISQRYLSADVVKR